MWLSQLAIGAEEVPVRAGAE